jgi:hypothetical protein
MSDEERQAAITRGGQIWIGRHHEGGDDGFVRVDDGSFDTRNTAPADVDLTQGSWEAWLDPMEAALAGVTPGPTGYELGMTSGNVDGFDLPVATCDGGGKHGAYPVSSTGKIQHHPKVSAARWLSATLPLHAVPGVYEGGDTPRHETKLFLRCATEVAVRPLPNDAWAVLDMHGHDKGWQIFEAGKPVATLGITSSLWFVVRPVP